MSRTTSLYFRQAAYAQETEHIPVLLLTIDDPTLPAPIFLSTDNNDTFDVLGETVRGTISNGINYIFMPMQITLPDDSEETISQCSITIDNVDQAIMEAVRTIQTPPTITWEIVLATTPDVREAYFPNFVLGNVYGDALTVSGTLSLGNFLSEPFPGGSMLPSNFPGLF